MRTLALGAALGLFVIAAQFRPLSVAGQATIFALLACQFGLNLLTGLRSGTMVLVWAPTAGRHDKPLAFWSWATVTALLSGAMLWGAAHLLGLI